MAKNQNQNQSDVVQHAINAAQSNAETQEEQQQIDQLSSQLGKTSQNVNTEEANATSESE